MDRFQVAHSVDDIGLGLAERRRVSKIFNSYYLNFDDYEKRKEQFLDNYWYMLEETERQFDSACENLKRKNRTCNAIQDFFRLKEKEAKSKISTGRRILLVRNGELKFAYKLTGEKALKSVELKEAHVRCPKALLVAEAQAFPGVNFDLPVSYIFYFFFFNF